MNCCNEYGDCRQGRDCPVRVAKVGRRTSATNAAYSATSASNSATSATSTASAASTSASQAATSKVAPIGRRDYAHEPLPPGPWRAYMRHLAKWMLIVLAVVTLTPLAVSLALAKAIEPPATDCGALIARLQPNVPAHVLIKCGGRV